MARWQRTRLPVQETQERWVPSLGQKNPLEEEMQPTPVLLPRKFHGQKSLEGYSPGDAKSQTRLYD